MSENSKSKKALTSALAIGLAAVMTIGGGTFAYLQGETEEVKNDFKRNKVMVELTETKGPEFSIVPGMTDEKDPKVTVDNTVDAYAYVEITDATEGLVKYELADGWTALEGYDNVYYREVPANADVKEFSVLKNDTVSYDASLTNTDMVDENCELKPNVALSFKAFAIQKVFDDPVNSYAVKDTPTAQAFDDIRGTLNTNNSEVILTNDVSLDATDLSAIQTNQKLQYKSTLNLADKTVSFTQSSDGKNFAPFYAMGGRANVTIEGNGTIESNGYCVDVVGSSKLQNPKLTINGGTYKGVITCVQVEIGTAYINDGFFQVDGDATYLLNCIDANYPNSAKIIVSGGTFVNFNPANNSAEGEGTNFVADGYHVEEAAQANGDIWYTVVKNA